MNNAKYRTSALVALAALLGACSSTPIAPAPVMAAQVAEPAPAPEATPRAATPAVVTGPRAPTSSPVATVTVPPYLDPKSEISMGRSAYFEYDKAVLKPEFAGIVERHGKYLMANPKLAVRLEGNTDEHGSAEYNLALGQKRAEAVRQALKLVGVPDARMEAISWGEERPRAAGHDESAWAENRRADIQYPGK